MPKIQEKVLESLYRELEKPGRLDSAMVVELRVLFQSAKKLKADDFVKILSNAKSGQP